MSNVLILGANGQVARVAIELFLKTTDTKLTLYLRNAKRLRGLHPSRTRIMEGDVLDAKKLSGAMVDQDVVYAKLIRDVAEKVRQEPVVREPVGVDVEGAAPGFASLQ